MKIPRLAHTFFVLISLTGWLQASVAEDTWPSKPITYIVPYPAGGTTDILARLITQKLGVALGTTIIVVNKPGATGTIGSSFVAKAQPDGYTILGTSTGPHAIYPALSAHPVYDAIKDFTPVILIGTIPSVLIVAGDSPFSNMMDIVNHARANPWKVKFASGGTGTILQMSGELLSLGTQTQMTHIPYKGDMPAIQDVMAGHVDFMFVPTSPVLAHIKAGKLKAIGTATTKRLPELPDVPTINEQGQNGFIAEQWQAIFLPPHTSLSIVQRYNIEINKILSDPDIIERLNQLGVTKIGGTSNYLADYQKSDITQWVKVGQAANISID